jgi:amino-acid N-acetyltransferase
VEPAVVIRKATIEDVPAIKELVNSYAAEGLTLPRSFSEIYENLRDFYIYESEGEVVGCAALHIVWEDVAEILSLAVRRDKTRQGIGTKLVEACISEARALGIPQVVTLTYAVNFFKKNGFSIVDKTKLPHKLWSMCIKCHKFPDCDETAMLRETQAEDSDKI